MTCFLLGREILLRHIPKTGKSTRLNLCIKHAFMIIMTHVKFYLNLELSPSPDQRMTEKAGTDSVKDIFEGLKILKLLA